MSYIHYKGKRFSDDWDKVPKLRVGMMSLYCKEVDGTPTHYLVIDNDSVVPAKGIWKRISDDYVTNNDGRVFMTNGTGTSAQEK